MRRTLALPLLLASGCGAVLGIEDRAVGPPSDVDAAFEADAGTDATGAEPPRSFCQSVTATFCHDFDAVLDPVAGWGGKVVFGEGSATLDPSGSPPSAPHAFRVVQPETLDSTRTGVYATEKEVRSAWPTARLGFRFFFKKAAWKTNHRNVGVAALLFPAPSGEGREIFVIVSATDLFVSANIRDFQSVRATRPLPFDQWVALTLEVSPPNGNKVRTKLTLDEAVVLDTSFTLGGGAVVDNVSLRIGIDNFNPPEPAFDVRYDDVVLNLE